MPKYTQTLTANSHTVVNVSNAYKTAFDNLGWGTGKVDILGGYRFTATDETNSNSTPLSVNSSSFMDNSTSSNNTIHYHPGKNRNGIIAMFLPGVVSVRLRYKIVRYDGASVSFTWKTSETSTNNRIALYWTKSATPTTDTSSINNINNYSDSTNLYSDNYTVTTGISQTTDWFSGDFVSHLTFVVALNDPNVYMVVEGVDWKVSQNKFAFQSPNLDSPNFELFTRTFSGNNLTTLVSLPFKNAKNALVKVDSSYKNDVNTRLRYGWIKQAWVNTLINSTNDSSNFGVMSLLCPLEIINWSVYSQDLKIYIGSNTTFDGFYLTTLQGTSWNGTVWDTVNKSTGFPNTVPQYPSVRKTLTESTVSGQRDYYETSWHHFSTSYQPNPETHTTHQLFKVINPANVRDFQFFWDFSGNNITYLHDKDPYQKQYIYIISSVIKQGSKYVITDVVASGVVDKTIIPASSLTISIPHNGTLQPGLYAISLISRGGRSEAYINSVESTLMENLSSYTYPQNKSRDIEFVGELTNLISPPKNYSIPAGGIRYIRETLEGTPTRWVEVQAFVGGTNVSQGIVPSSDTTLSNASYATNGNLSSGQYCGGGNGSVSITLDLGSVKNVDTIKTYHDWTLETTSRSKLEVSVNGTDWVTIFMGYTTETSSGNSYPITYPINPVATYVSYDISSLVGSEYSHGRRFYRTDGLVRVRIIQTGSGTPVSARTLFSENWVNVNGVWSHSDPYLPILNSITRSYGSLSYHSTATKFYTRFPFGLDSQMTQWSTQPYLLCPYPGAGYSTLEFNDKNNATYVEFGTNSSRFDDDTPFRKAWASSLHGTSLQLNNTFFVNTPGTLNTSRVTTQDGREYITWIAGNNSSYSKYHLDFRLRP